MATVTDIWVPVLGQDEAVAQLQAAVHAPVHAYLFVGPPGSGRRAAARAFAAELFAAGANGEAADRHRRLAQAEEHPDLVVVERRGASIPVGERERPEEGSARWVAQRAALSPVDAARSVYVLLDFHLVSDAAPVLLKTIEEPPAHVVFIVVADEVTPDLVTIASRCVQVEFRTVPSELIEHQLITEGAEPDTARVAAQASLGSLDRARLLVGDPRIALRLKAWTEIPARLDGTGATAAALAAEVAAVLDDAQAPLEERHRAELEDLAARTATTGERGSGRKELDARHRRETRRLRHDELRFGFSTLAQSYRTHLGTMADPQPVLEALEALTRASESLVRNPNEALLLQALMLRLAPLA